MIQFDPAENPFADASWELIRAEAHGDNVYAIVDYDDSNVGWTSHGRFMYNQIEVATVPSGSGSPPRYPAYMLFQLVPVDD
ncbi:hypothetical protein NLI96_g12657 [Meripilus lineatus]|uniref:Uncharacterized protein n=1 Tax=Meripilus lineatus TaxID=2056292 RepID=A0AAD5UR78_9APHY|nr:hypothetical protein NLI96_g12657 [Physisporinus lineatus]